MLHQILSLLPTQRSLTAAHPELCIQLVQARLEVVIQLALHLRDACALDVQGAQWGVGGVNRQLILQGIAGFLSESRCLRDQSAAGGCSGG